MDLNAMHIRLHRVRELLHLMDAQIGSMETLDGKRFPEKFEAISTETALQSEKAACILRQILYDSGTVSKALYLGKAASSQGVKITFGDGILEVALPCLLPKKRGRYSNQFLLDPLNAALEQFNRTLPIPRFRECTVCFVHVFRSDRSSRKYFDYDNLQQKQILDVIALHAMVDDNSLLCDVHHTAEPGETDETKVFVMPKNRFPEWLNSRENGG